MCTHLRRNCHKFPAGFGTTIGHLWDIYGLSVGQMWLVVSSDTTPLPLGCSWVKKGFLYKSP